MREMILVGTSGWHYAHWKGPFYPSMIRSDDMLDFYTQRFSTVEVNNSFYHLPSKETFSTWKKQTPAGFTFAVKASRYITHMKKLKDPAPALKQFLSRTSALGEKLGPIIFQLPPRWRRDAPRMSAFLNALPKGHHYVFELRDPTWAHEEVYSLLEKHNSALCVFDLAGQKSQARLTADFSYFRLHGPATEKYSGRYTKSQLQTWLKKAKDFLTQGARQVYIYFDNDQAGYAAVNALELRKMARGPTSEETPRPQNAAKIGDACHRER